MTNNMKIKLIANAFVAISAASIFSIGNAEASMSTQLKHCGTNNRSATIHCCEAIVGQHLPVWMRESGRNCTTQVHCNKKYCYIQFETLSNQGGEDKSNNGNSGNKEF